MRFALNQHAGRRIAQRHNTVVGLAGERQLKCLFIALAGVLLSCSAIAQQVGTVNFGNSTSTLISNAQTASPIDSAEGVRAALYWAPAGSTSFGQIGGFVSVGVPIPGIYGGGTRTTGPATPGGGTGQFRVRAWGGGYASYEEALQVPGVLIGESPIVQVKTGNPVGAPPTPPGSLAAAGLQAFALSPNPGPPVDLTDMVYVTARPTPSGGGANPNGSYFEFVTPAMGDTSARSSITDAPTRDGSRFYSSSTPLTDTGYGIAIWPRLNVPGEIYRIEHTLNSDAGNVATNSVFSVTCTNGDLSISETDVFQQNQGDSTWRLIGFVTNRAGSSRPWIEFKYNSGFVNGSKRWTIDCFRLTLFEPCMAVPMPIVQGPVSAGQDHVIVTSVASNAAAVTVYQSEGTNMVPIGQLLTGMVEGTNIIPVVGIVKGRIVAATQTVGGQESCLEHIGPIAGGGANPRIRVALGIRESPGAEGPIGANGAAFPSQNLHFLGVSELISGTGVPANGLVLHPTNTWQTITLQRGIHPTIQWAGTNVGDLNDLQGQWGALDTIAFCADDLTDTGPFDIFIDDLQNGTTVFQDFETAEVGETHFSFHPPRSSGTTKANLLGVPDEATISDQAAYSGRKSLRVRFQFVDNDPRRWLRLTTYYTTNGTPLPLVDLDQPITLRLALLPVGQTPLPVIVQQPASLTNVAGTTAIFSVIANSIAPMDYQWQRNGTNLIDGGNISGATTPTLTLANVAPADAASYRVLITCSSGAVTSELATLEVGVPPTIVDGRLNVALQSEGGVAAATTVGCYEGCRYPYYVNDGNLSTFWAGTSYTTDWVQVTLSSNQVISEVILRVHAHTTTYSVLASLDGVNWETLVDHATSTNASGQNAVMIHPVNPTAARIVRVRIWNSNSPATHIFKNAFFELEAYRTLPGQPQDQVVALGSSATFAVRASGSPPLTYQWSHYGTNLPGATASSFSIASASLNDSGPYTVLISNAFGAVTSETAVLTVVAPPVIISHPRTQALPIGYPVTFEVVADSLAPLSYQWLRNGTNLPGATAATFTIPSIQAEDEGMYACFVSNLAGGVLSADATLTVFTQGNCVPAPSGLLAWWPGNGSTEDLMGVNDGSIIGGAGFDTGLVGQAFRFSETNDCVEVPNTASLGLDGSFTVEAWIKPRVAVAAMPLWPKIVSKQDWSDTNAAPGWSLYCNGTASDWPGLLGFGVQDASGTGRFASTATPDLAPVDAWTHVAGVYDKAAGLLRFYLNGVLQQETDAMGLGSITSSVPLYIGVSNPGWDHFDGAIDEVSIYSRALSSNEVFAVYAAGTAGKCQLPAYVNGFDLASSTNSWTVWWGPPNPLLSWDAAVDAGTNPASGSLKVVENFSGKAGEQFMIFGTFGNQYPWDNSYVLDGTTFDSVAFDLKVAEGTAPTVYGHYATIEVGLVAHDWSRSGAGVVDVPLTNDWMHVSIPLNVSWTNLSSIVGISFQIWSDGVFTSPLTCWVDNVQLLREGAQRVPVTFQVDLTDEIAWGVFRPEDGTVMVQGSFNGWGSWFTLTNSPSNPTLYSGTMNMSGPPGTVIEYRFALDNYGGPGQHWESIPNRSFVLPDTPTILPVATFNNGLSIPLKVGMEFEFDLNAQITSGLFNTQSDEVWVRGLGMGWGAPPSGLQLLQDAARLGIFTNVFTMTNLLSGEAFAYQPTIWKPASSNVVRESWHFRAVVFNGTEPTNTAGYCFQKVGPYCFNDECLLRPPEIVMQPDNQTNMAGSTATFTVTATGTQPMTYHWRKDGVALDDGGNVAGANTATLTVRSLTSGSAGNYDVVLANPLGTVTSRVATLSVYTLGTSWNASTDYSSTSNPNGVWSYNRKWVVGGTACDLMTVRWGTSGWYLGNAGHGGPSIQGGPLLWAKDNSNGYPAVRWRCPESGHYSLSGRFTGVDSRGVDNQVYVVINGATVFSGRVRGYQSSVPFNLADKEFAQNDVVDFVIVWAGGVYSEYSWTDLDATIIAATIAIPSPVITVQPQGRTNLSGTTATFEVRAVGTDPLAYQWRFNGTNLVDGGKISGAATDLLSVEDVQPENAGDYTVLVSNFLGSATSQVAVLSVITPCVTVSAPISTYPMGTPVALQARSFDCATSNTLADVSGVVYVMTAGTTRTLPFTTDATGQATVSFPPLAGEAGHYGIGAGLPGEAQPPAQDEFAVVGVEFTPNHVSQHLIVGVPATSHLGLRNLTDVPLTGVTATLVGAPLNVVFQIEAPDVLAGNGTNALTCMLQASGPAPTTDCVLRVTSAEGAVNDLPVRIQVVNPVPVLVATPATLERSMVRSRQTLVEVELANLGGAAAHDIRAILPTGQSWLSLVSTQTIAVLNVGETTTVTFALSPPADLPLQNYPSYIRLRATETDLILPFDFQCVSALQGDLLVVATDENTYLTEEAPKVANAEVTVRERSPGTNVITGVTDASGVVLFTNLVEDYYQVSVTAENHGSFSTTYLVEAGRDNKIVAFLSQETVSYDWTVITNSETDDYEVDLETVFDVTVPWPSLTITPADINLCSYQEGTHSVYLAITNHSLIDANNLKLTFPSHPAWEIIPQAQLIGNLPAQSGTVVPVTIHRTNLNGNVSSRMDGLLTYSFVGNGMTFPRSVAVIVRNADAWDCVPAPQITLEPKELNLCGFPDDTNVTFTIRNLGAMDVEGMTLAFDSHVHWVIDPRESDLGTLPAQSSRTVTVHFTKQAWPTSGASRIDGRLAYYATLQGETRWFSRVTKLYNPNPWDCVPQPLVTITPDALDLCGFETNWVNFMIHNRGPVPVEDLALAFPPHPQWDIQLSVTNRGTLDPQDTWVVPVLFTRRPSITNGPSPIAGTLNYRATVEGETRHFSPAIPLYGPNPWDCVPWPPVTISPWYLDLCHFRSKTNDVYFTVHNRSPVSTPVGKLVFDNTHPRWRIETPPDPVGNLAPGAAEIVHVRFIDDDPTTNGRSRIYGSIDFEATVRLQTRSGLLTVVADNANDSDCYTIPCIGCGGGGGGGDGYLHEQGTVRLQQHITVERNTFKATLSLTNKSDLFALTNLAVTLDILDADGKPAADRFGIRLDVVDGLGAIDGTGALNTNSSGVVSWTLIPATNAAPAGPTRYTVGGEVVFFQDGQRLTIQLYPAPITVLPDPKLILDYFWERTSYSDDALTLDVVEPAVPFAVGLLMRNEGNGTARAITAKSTSLKIVDNESGVLINFNMVGAEVNGQSVWPDPTLQLGDLAPSNTVEAIWWLTSSLLADFIEYNATFTHLDDLGNRNLSLIHSVSNHPLLHVVRADVPFDDGIKDFLVSEGYPTNVLPQSLYFSGGGIAPVSSVTNGRTDGTPTPDATNVLLTADLPAGWVYVRVDDPAPTTVVLSSVQRSDGRSLTVGPNVWSTHRIVYPVSGSPYREDFLHLFDYVTNAGTYTYTLGYNIAPEPPFIISQPVNSTNLLGTDACFSVVAGGTEPLTYEWFHNGVRDLRSAGPELCILGITAEDAGEYYVRVSNAAGSVNSQTAWLEVLIPPDIVQVPDQIAIVGRPLAITNVAYDADLPIVFTFGTNRPPGSTLTADGVFKWTPLCEQGSRNYLVTICATDSAVQPSSNCMTFRVEVPECIQASLGRSVVQAGHTGSVSIHLISTTVLTNMAFTMLYPPDRFTTNFGLIIDSQEILTQRVEVVSPGMLAISFTLSPDRALHGPTNVGGLSFEAISPQSSAFVPLPIIDVTGLKPDGALAANAFGLPGRVVIVGEEPLLEAWRSESSNLLLTLYAIPDRYYLISYSTNSLAAPAWWPGWGVTMTNLWQTWQIPPTESQVFYGVRQ